MSSLGQPPPRHWGNPGDRQLSSSGLCEDQDRTDQLGPPTAHTPQCTPKAGQGEEEMEEIPLGPPSDLGHKQPVSGSQTEQLKIPTAGFPRPDRVIWGNVIFLPVPRSSHLRNGNSGVRLTAAAGMRRGKSLGRRRPWDPAAGGHHASPGSPPRPPGRAGRGHASQRQGPERRGVGPCPRPRRKPPCPPGVHTPAWEPGRVRGMETT